ncbi:ATPase involved in DNA repair [Legionella lansingensis]|uniref:Uncharacterized protein n=1 Tax=Legionella lansingensis TaxID=45067 RepID=A0A0W0VT72_9GAMM|nr:hypothetical protein [Legionella lansingensis]KTD23355.1 hypothetical protein Llan_0922 [Legionella lansingensis]SNV55378.1 ATPase involved in DNA repair [Legionella lansingensis]
MKREELLNKANGLKERLNSEKLKINEPTKRDELVVDSKGLATRIHAIIDKITALPEGDITDLQGYYERLEQMLNAFEDLVETKEKYCAFRNRVSSPKARKSKDPELDAINAYLPPVITEIKQKVYPEEGPLLKDKAFKAAYMKLQQTQKAFIEQKDKIIALEGLEQSKKFEQLYVIGEIYLNDYRKLREQAEKRRDEIYAQIPELAQVIDENKTLLLSLEKAINQLSEKEINAEQYTALYELIKNKKYLSQKENTDLVNDYKEAIEACRTDNKEIKTTIEKIQSEIKAFDEWDKRLRALEEEQKSAQEWLKLSEEVLLDAELKKARDALQKTCETYGNRVEQMQKILWASFAPKGKIEEREIVLAMYNEYAEEYKTNGVTLQERVNKLKEPYTEFHNQEKKRNALFEEFNQLKEEFRKLGWSSFKEIPLHGPKDYLETARKGSVDLVTIYQDAKKECEKDTEQLSKDIETLQAEIELIKKQKVEQAKAFEVLKHPREHLSAETCLDKIAANHEAYLKKNMVTHLELLAASDQVKTVQEYTGEMGAYHKQKEAYLKSAIQPVSLASKLGFGALAALLGAGAAGLSVFAAKKSSVLDKINPLSGIKDATTGVFGALVGAGVGYAAYQAWLAATKNKADDTSYALFQKEMEKAGFTDAKYKELSDEIVKLFHFRECVLLGIKDSAGTNMRDEFKRKLGGNVDDATLNTAIEVYFLDQLSQSFNRIFGEIYTIHDQEIKKAQAEQGTILGWIKGYFEKAEDRQRFTQQMQVAFMENCLLYLSAQMNEPGFLAKYPAVTASVGGLIAGVIAGGVAVAIIGGPVTLSIVAIALVFTAITAVTTYLIVTNIDYLSLKRGKDNREAIQEAIDLVCDEKQRLEFLIESVTETTDEDVKQLEKFGKEGDTPFAAYLGWGEEKSIALGTGMGWIREHASRYRHSKLVKVGLEGQHKDLVEKADKQTQKLQAILVSNMAWSVTHPELKKFIQDTREYLNNRDNQTFIDNFDLKKKIKEQILQIVSAVPLTSDRKLPKELVDFYIKDLGGSLQDLEDIRKFAPVVAGDKLAQSLTLKTITDAAISLDNKLSTTNAKRAQILRGDNTYRDMLGLPKSSEAESDEAKINQQNIDRYLNNSYEFLIRLLNDKQDGTGLEAEFRHSDEFMIYSTLLIKQLAHLADPNNHHVNPVVRRKIREFTKNTLGVDPDVVFNNVLAHSLMQEEASEETIEVANGRRCHVNHLYHIADAIAVGIAHNFKKMTPMSLIERELFSFAREHKGETKLFYGESLKELQPNLQDDYHVTVENALNLTKELMAQIGTQPLLINAGVGRIYIQGCIEEISTLVRQIDAFKESNKGKNISSLEDAQRKLVAFQKGLESALRSEIELSSERGFVITEEDETLETPLELFIEAVKEHKSDLDKRRSQWGNRFNWNKHDLAVTTALLRALEDLNEGHPATFNEKITKSSHLGKLVNQYLPVLGVKSLDELFHPPSKEYNIAEVK